MKTLVKLLSAFLILVLLCLYTSKSAFAQECVISDTNNPFYPLPGQCLQIGFCLPIHAIQEPSDSCSQGDECCVMAPCMADRDLCPDCDPGYCYYPLSSQPSCVDTAYRVDPALPCPPHPSLGMAGFCCAAEPPPAPTPTNNYCSCSGFGLGCSVLENECQPGYVPSCNTLACNGNVGSCSCVDDSNCGDGGQLCCTGSLCDNENLWCGLDNYCHAFLECQGETSEIYGDCLTQQQCVDQGDVTDGISNCSTVPPSPPRMCCITTSGKCCNTDTANTDCPSQDQYYYYTCNIDQACPGFQGQCERHTLTQPCCDPTINPPFGGCEQIPGRYVTCSQPDASCTGGYRCNSQPIPLTVASGPQRIDFSRLYSVIQPFSARFRFSRTLPIGTIIFTALLFYVYPFAGIILLVFVIYAGATYLLSIGEPGLIQRSWAILTNALIGFIILFTAYWITQVVGTILGIEEVGRIFA